MKKRKLTQKLMARFEYELQQQERSAATVEKYLHDVRQFWNWLNGRLVTQQAVVEWKGHLLTQNYEAGTINGKLAAINALFRILGWDECKVKSLRIQRRAFREDNKELTRKEYLHLVRTAERQGKKRLAMLLQTICGTGIRVSEVRYITVESLYQGRVEISLKGKIRTILLPKQLCHKLLQYARKNKIASGEVFLTRSGKTLSRKQIWADMKALCNAAGIAPDKVFPHNLRHLFARTFYHTTHDVVKLADVLGHSNLTTTRIYLISTGAEHLRELDSLGLIS